MHLHEQHLHLDEDVQLKKYDTGSTACWDSYLCVWLYSYRLWYSDTDPIKTNVSRENNILWLLKDGVRPFSNYLE